jgi:imidazolonepropionase-like amidohydrolase
MISTAMSRRAVDARAAFVVAILAIAPALHAQGARGAPDRRAGEGKGPFQQLTIRGVMLIDGTGAPPRGPVDIVVRGNRILRVASAGTPGIPARGAAPGGRGAAATPDSIIEGRGMFVMPGFIDLHTHTGGPEKAPDAEYVYKLWLAHGVTTARDAGAGASDAVLKEKARSAANQIVEPRIWAYARPGSGEGWTGGAIETPEVAREWVRWAAKKGADGLKLDSHRPEIMAALIDEAKKNGIGTMAHLSQMGVAQMNALDAARLGLGSMEHFSGLFESMYDGRTVQSWPSDMNYSDEQRRFGQVARQATMVTPHGPKWNALLKEFKALDFTLNPTVGIYSAGRDVMRLRNADWHDKYTLPSLADYYEPSRRNHGSYWFDWTTADEIAWKKFYGVWLDFINEYKNMGGRVTLGTDAGFIYSTYGFAYPMEMEMFQEAGFDPLEVIRAGTMHAAEVLYKPSAKTPELGIVRAGMLADLVIVDQNPLQNLKVLYGTGAVRLNDSTGQVERVGGVKYTVKDGIVYDAKKLLADAAAMVAAQKAARPRSNGGMIPPAWERK